MKRFRLSAIGLVALSTVLMLGGCDSSPQPPANAFLPFGSLDGPRNGSLVKGTLNVEGWALCEDGISGVNIYIDRKLLRSGDLNATRPDVAAAYGAKYANADKSAFSHQVNADDLTPGEHELIVEAKSQKGLTRDLGRVTINVQK